MLGPIGLKDRILIIHSPCIYISIYICIKVV